MKLQGKIKTIIFKGERVSVLLEDARVFTEDQKWILYTDVGLVKDGKYKKGETWLSSFNEHIYQACRELGKGEEVEVGVVVSERGFKNIKGISLKLLEKDVNEDLEPPNEPLPEEETPPEEETSIAVDKSEKDRHIIRECCIKAVGYAVNLTSLKDVEEVNAFVAEFVAIAKRLEKYVLEGK